MAIILVVDDSPVDRRVLAGLLTRDDSQEWIVQYAENGVEALEHLDLFVPDLVITDVHMPQMDGLELVAAIREQHPRVPVILTTAQGSESMAIKALETGAAGYVPKAKLAEDLLDTVKQVLSVSSAEHNYRQLIDCFVKTRYTLHLTSNPDLVAPLIQLVQKTLEEMKFGDKTARVHVGVSVEEAVINALLHGSLELSGEQAALARAEMGRGMRRTIEQRLKEARYRDRKILIDARFTPEDVRFVIRDPGPGCPAARLPRRGDPSTLKEGAGRGLILIHNFMDEVTFNKKGNELTMCKKAPQRS